MWLCLFDPGDGRLLALADLNDASGRWRRGEQVSVEVVRDGGERITVRIP